MTIAASGYKFKKDLKGSIGKRLHYTETSMFGPEYPKSGNGEFSVVGPSEYERNWFARVTVKDHLIVKVT